MGTVDPALLLSLGDLWGPLGALLILAALPCVLLVALKPRLLWPLLIVAAVIGIGPRIKGYMILDEALILASLAGAVLHLVMRAPVSDQVPARPVDRLVFGAWSAFMVLQSIRGIFATDDPRVMRWVLLYGSLWLMFAVVNYRNRYFPFPRPRTALLLILWSTFVSYVAYLGQGVYYDSELGTYGRFLSQDYVWAGSAVAVFPTLVGLPAALLLAGDDSRRVRLLVWATVVLMIAVAFYFQSRISWFVMAAFVPFGWRVVRVRQFVAAFALFVVLFAVFMPNPVEDAAGFADELIQTAGALWDPAPSDVGRTLQLKAGVMTVLEDPVTMFVGTGIYAHRFAIVPAIVRLFEEFLPEQNFIMPGTRIDAGLGLTIFRTTGFTAMLIDTGVLGLLWFAALFALCGARVLAIRSSARFILAVPVVVAFGWLLSNNTLEVMLLYVLIMPGGLLQRLAQAVGEQEAAAAAARPLRAPSMLRTPMPVPAS